MSKAFIRIKNIKKSFDDIKLINSQNLKTSEAINDVLVKPAIRMHIIKIAEQFNKLKEENEFYILEKFDKDDLRGLSAVRNFIAHDYDSVDDELIEDVLRYNFPKIEKIIKEILENYE